MPAFSVAASVLGKSSMPLPDMNAFSPTAPQSRNASMASSFPGTSPPHNAKSTCDFLSAIARFAMNDSASHVGGVELSGMSKKVVVPPAAHAREPVSMPSQSARPGSLKCTCASMTPGSASQPPASILSRAEPSVNAAIRPSTMPMAGRFIASWMSRSKSGMSHQWVGCDCAANASTKSRKAAMALATSAVLTDSSG